MKIEPRRPSDNSVPDHGKFLALGSKLNKFRKRDSLGSGGQGSLLKGED